VAEAFEFCLRVFDVEGAVESAFGGERGDSSDESGDGAESDFADFAECAADAAGEAGGSFGSGFVDGGGDVAFEGFAEVFAGGFDLDVYGADVLCHGIPCCAWDPMAVGSFGDVEHFVEVMAAFHARLMFAVGFLFGLVELVGAMVCPWSPSFAFESAFEFELVPEAYFGCGGRVRPVGERRVAGAGVFPEDFPGALPCFAVCHAGFGFVVSWCV
jgi:hypothetical protein